MLASSQVENLLLTALALLTIFCSSALPFLDRLTPCCCHCPATPCCLLLLCAEKACSWPVVHKAITTFGSGPSEEQRIHHAHPHEPALLRAPSQLCLFEPDPLRSSMASLAAHSVRSVTSRVSANGASHPMPVLSASSAGPTIYGTADSPGPWTREEGGKAGSAPLVLMEPEAYEQLQLGTVALLEGRPSVALAHFVQAHVFGFLPCLLVSAALRQKLVPGP